jgi:hypothetical protein
MPLYRVKTFIGAVWDERPECEATASTPKEAAEQVCGVRLREDAGAPGQLRAQVYEPGKPQTKALFFTLLEPRPLSPSPSVWLVRRTQ